MNTFHIVASPQQPHLNNHQHVLNDAIGFLSLFYIPNVIFLTQVI